jgi:uncharacterized OsmC-like protein
MTAIRVTHLEHDRYRVDIRHHSLVVDQPPPGGGDEGPTPTELFVASLASCAAHYVGRFVARRPALDQRFAVECDYEMSTIGPHRVSAVELRIALADEVSPDVADAIVRSAEHCTVRSSIEVPPDVRVSVRTPVPA